MDFRRHTAVNRASSPPYSHDKFGQGTPAQRTDAEMQAARERFERHFGEVDLGYATGDDNEQIDADLAKEYARTDQPN